MKVIQTQMICGMPHLLSNFDLNLNHMSKVLGDIHWHYMYDRPSDATEHGSRIYQSFLRLDFNIVDTFKEDDILNIATTGGYIDDAIFKTEHVFGKNKITLYSIGIIISNGSIIKSNQSSRRDKAFWTNHRTVKRVRYEGKQISFPTYPSIDFNCAGILYCANYVKFVYQYADMIRNNVDIKAMYFFGNIQPYDQITVIHDNHLHITSNGRLIATCICNFKRKHQDDNLEILV